MHPSDPFSHSSCRFQHKVNLFVYSLLVMQCSAGRSRFFIRPCRTDLTDGRWTNCNTNRWDYRREEEKCHSWNGIIISLFFFIRYSHNSRLLRWSEQCYVLVGTRVSGTRACERSCCHLFRYIKVSHWHWPNKDLKVPLSMASNYNRR